MPDDHNQDPVDGEANQGFLAQAGRSVAKNGIKMAIAAPLLSYVMFMIVAAAIVIFIIAGIGKNPAAKLFGSGVKEIAGLISPDLKKKIKEELGDDLKSALDCSNLPPAERKPNKNCVEGLLDDGNRNSPVPARAEWMVPVWQRAGERHKVPWELLAAVEAARSNFGLINCKSDRNGTGVYRIQNNSWDNFSENGGKPKSLRKAGNCAKAKGPAKLYKNNEVKRSGADKYDPVDAAFSYSWLVADRGAKGAQKWAYTGSMPNDCTTPESDGRVWYLPEDEAGGGSGKFGYNKNLKISRELQVISNKYRHNSGPWKPRRDVPGNGPYKRMPKGDLMKLLEGAWKAFGKRGEEARRNAALNYLQISRESGGRPYIMQGFIGDVNDNNPAGGLMQFIPGTFDHWKVSGFNDRFNPLHNILATVNAQVNGPYPILRGASGWSPPFSRNPYASGGKVTTVSPDEAEKEQSKPQPYKGKDQTDRVSQAVRGAGGKRASKCYTAVVYEWYKAIKANPPAGAGGDISGGPNGTKKITGGGRWVPIPKDIAHDPGDYIDVRLIDDLRYFDKKYKLHITDGYSGPLPGGKIVGCMSRGRQCHGVNGEHPLGLGIDGGPQSGGWGNIDKMAKDFEPSQNKPKAPFRWVGYNGDANHGTGNHIHMSWQHSPTPPYRIAKWVLVMKFTGSTEDTGNGGDDARADGTSCNSSGPVLVIGDSLSVGMEKHLKQAIDNKMDYNARVNRASAEGLSLVKSKIRRRHKVVVFAIGTNDNPDNPNRVVNRMRLAKKRIGPDRCLVVSTVARPGGAKLNKAIRKFANSQSRVALVDWHQYADQNKDKMAGDGIHATSAGYAARARLFATAITGSADGAGGGGDAPVGDAKGAVRKIIKAANKINSKPYRYGGGHASFNDTGYDCSGSVSYALHGAGLVKTPMASGGFMKWGKPGKGKHVTIYANGGHMYMVVNGRRFDTSAMSGNGGKRWTKEPRSHAGFTVRHPPGL